MAGGLPGQGPRLLHPWLQRAGSAVPTEQTDGLREGILQRARQGETAAEAGEASDGRGAGLEDGRGTVPGGGGQADTARSRGREEALCETGHRAAFPEELGEDWRP